MQLNTLFVKFWNTRINATDNKYRAPCGNMNIFNSNDNTLEIAFTNIEDDDIKNIFDNIRSILFDNGMIP